MVEARILIADDSKMNQQILSEILGVRYEYLYADDGMQALDLLHSEFDIDLLLLDINMLRLDGFGVLEVMKQRNWLQEVRCALLKDALVIVMLDRLGTGKQLLPMREQVTRGVGVLLDLDDLGPVVHQVHTINGRAVLAEHLEHLLLKLHGLQILLERLLLFFQQRQHAQVLPRAAEVPADKGKQAVDQFVHLLLAA